MQNLTEVQYSSVRFMARLLQCGSPIWPSSFVYEVGSKREAMTQFDLATSDNSAGVQPEEHLHRPRVLIIDDDELVLSALQNLFQLKSHYELDTETNPTRAARLLMRKRFDVVISDFLMPEMDGIQLLEIAARLQPRATRILLTGYGDNRRIQRAVRDLGFHYMDKPWDNAAILEIVESAVRTPARAR